MGRSAVTIPADRLLMTRAAGALLPFMASLFLLSCSGRSPGTESDSSAVSADSRTEGRAESWTDDELFGFMNAAFAELSGQGLEIARRARGSALRRLGRDVSAEFRPLARRSDSLAHTRGVVPAHNRVDSLLRVLRGTEPAHRARAVRDRQLAERLESALTTTLGQLNDARVPGRSPEINLLLDSGRSALWRAVDGIRRVRQNAERGQSR